METRVAIVQSNYIPWKGYFDLIRAVDVFVLYDDVQYTKNDWRNRNRIKTATGPQWLTIPVRQESLQQSILETRTVDDRWRRKHWASLVQAYAHAPHLGTYRDRLEQLYLGDDEQRLSRINERFIREICDMLGIRTAIRRSEEFRLPDGKTERLVELCSALGAAAYLSGPAARCYLEESRFADAGISVIYADYANYPEYEQSHPPFEHAVSVLDLLLHAGPAAPRFLRNVAGAPPETSLPAAA